MSSKQEGGKKKVWFVSRKARNGSDFPVGHLLLKVSLVIFYPADCVHQCLPTNVQKHKSIQKQLLPNLHK